SFRKQVMHGPYVVLSPIAKSHPFEERRVHVGPDEDPLKIGRAVARLKAAKDNAIFDCKVLSRNHAVLSYRNGGFFLRDTKSSNGTFVNNERLAVTGEESEARQIFTGDIIQFGVEIVENTNKVAHGCIYAMVQLFDASGQMIETGGTLSGGELNGTMPNCEPSLVNNHQLFQMQQYLSEALYREEARQQKLEALEKMLEATEHASEAAWKALVNEDRLLSRIETLEAQLATFSKNATPDKLREDILALIDDKAKFEVTSKEQLRRAQEERAESALRLADIDRSLVSTEEECNRLRSRIQTLEGKLSETVNAYEAKVNDCNNSQIALVETERRLAAAEEKASTAETRLGEMESKAQHERSVSYLVRLLVSALNNNPTVNENDRWLTMLYDVLREKNIAVDAVPDAPVIKLPKADLSSNELISCKRCEYIKDLNARETLIRAEMETYLKDNLQLQARVRDLESELAIAVSPVCIGKPQLELDSAQTLGISPPEKRNNNVQPVTVPSGPAEPLVIDRLHDTVFIISLAPFLAIILLMLAPFHMRFMQYIKQD
uniref:FHA domain-containing protein n=1 Tax=Haemonchus contortus TaxID=6289 RepID=A0A7I5EBJ6_HAECO